MEYKICPERKPIFLFHSKTPLANFARGVLNYYLSINLAHLSAISNMEALINKF